MRRPPVLLLVTLLAACSSAAQHCTLAGCTSGVSFEAPGLLGSTSPGALTICADEDCRAVPFPADPAVVSGRVDFPDLGAGARVTATLVMPDGRRYTDEAEATTIRPNGPDCDPTCVVATLMLVGSA